MYGVMEFYREAVKRGIKPFLGVKCTLLPGAVTRRNMAMTIFNTTLSCLPGTNKDMGTYKGRYSGQVPGGFLL